MGTKWIHEKMESQELETMGRENLVEEFYYISRAEKRDGDNHLTEKLEHLFFFENWNFFLATPVAAEVPRPGTKSTP